MFVDMEDFLINTVYALLCCNVVIGGMWMFGVVP